jgi:hypothetical protein
MKTNPFKNLLKTAFLFVAVLLSFAGFGQNSLDKSSYASSLASISKTPTYKWEGLPVFEESDTKEIIPSSPPLTCLTLSTSVTDLVCSEDSRTGQISLTVAGGVAPYEVELLGPITNVDRTLSAGTYTTNFTFLAAGNDICTLYTQSNNSFDCLWCNHLYMEYDSQYCFNSSYSTYNYYYN